jgi:hypothetical protein
LLVNIHSCYLKNENMVENDDVCPRVKQVYDTLISSPDYVKYEQSYDDLRAQLGKALGIAPEQVVFQGMMCLLLCINNLCTRTL